MEGKATIIRIIYLSRKLKKGERGILLVQVSFKHTKSSLFTLTLIPYFEC